MTARAQLYFSFRSPFSWLLVERLRRIDASLLDELELIPYWEPDGRTAAELAEVGAVIHYAPMSRAKHLYILQDVKRLATGLGLAIRWPVDVEPWWEPSHLGWLAARRLGRAREFYDAVVAARWLQGADISRPEVVERAARTAGVDPAVVALAPEDPEIRAEGVSCLQRAWEEDIFGVPYLRLGWRRYWGYDRLEHFLRDATPGAVAPPVAPEPLPVAVIEGESPYDNDTAGGCG